MNTRTGPQTIEPALFQFKYKKKESLTIKTRYMLYNRNGKLSTLNINYKNSVHLKYLLNICFLFLQRLAKISPD